MDANAVLSLLSDYRAAAYSLQASTSAIESKVQQLETENRHLTGYKTAARTLEASKSALEARVNQLQTENEKLMTKLKAFQQQAESQQRQLNEMLRQTKQRLASTENTFSAVIATMSPLKQRQDQILQTLKDISQSMSHRSDGTNNVLPVMAAIPQTGLREPIITPDEHIQPRILPTTDNSVFPAILRAPIDQMGSKIQQKPAISPPSSPVASPCRQAVTTDTEKKQNPQPQLKRALVCLQPGDRSMAEAARQREEKKIKVELE